MGDHVGTRGDILSGRRTRAADSTRLRTAMLSREHISTTTVPMLVLLASTLAFYAIYTHDKHYDFRLRHFVIMFTVL